MLKTIQAYRLLMKKLLFYTINYKCASLTSKKLEDMYVKDKVLKQIQNIQYGTLG